MSDLISRQDAVDAVEAKIKWFDGDAIEDRCKRDAFIQVLDEILTELPSVEPKHDGDLISRQDAIELVKESYYNLAENMDDVWAMVEDIEKLSSARPTGEWIVHDHGVTYWYKCNRCGGAGDKEDKFCKHCGAKMEGENHE